MAYVDVLPSKAEIFSYWKDRFDAIGIFFDLGGTELLGVWFSLRPQVRPQKAGRRLE
jgi:hypothetical protein